MRHERGQPETVRCTRSPARANANAGSISIATTTTSTGVTFDIPRYLIRAARHRPDKCGHSGAGREPPLRNSGFLLRGPHDRYLHFRAFGLRLALGTGRK